MAINTAREVAALRQMSVGELQAKYAEVFGDQSRGRHRVWLLRRIAWRQQAVLHGDLSHRAQQRAEELANDADLRLTAPTGHEAAQGERATTTRAAAPPDGRLPIPGTLLTRQYKGRTLVVKILSDGFEFDGQGFPSLSAVAKAATGSHWNGFHFFGLTKNGATT